MSCRRRAARSSSVRLHDGGRRTGSRLIAADVVDAVLEGAVVPSFTRVGCAVRSRLDDWTPLAEYELDGRVVLITGATSGLGRAAAELLARAQATVILLGREAVKTRHVRNELAAATSNDSVHDVVADLTDLASVNDAAAELLERFDQLDAVLHNAGALHAERQTTRDGLEATVAVQVVAPFLLTSRLLDRLRAAGPGRVLTMSSGGMYTAPLAVDDLEMAADNYRGTEQYARAKRAQVALNEMWAGAVDRQDVVFHAIHPGWADTPGVETSLPRFHRLMRPLLRTPAEGADTIAWLAAEDGRPLAGTGGFWHDRRRRPIHRLGRTRHSDTAERREALWAWCVERSGVDPLHPARVTAPNT
ncbi:MAG: dehydrogenase, short-chain alcohol dehydrogenase like [Desertimonas sp.]|nr:dehydrogenase, short-chain alcohol dehydrogenase like [Desertimonas sp.]